MLLALNAPLRAVTLLPMRGNFWIEASPRGLDALDTECTLEDLDLFTDGGQLHDRHHLGRLLAQRAAWLVHGFLHRKLVGSEARIVSSACAVRSHEKGSHALQARDLEPACCRIFFFRS